MENALYKSTIKEFALGNIDWINDNIKGVIPTWA